MFKEALQKDGYDERYDKGYKHAYIYLVSLESIENSSALAALVFIDISGALLGALLSITFFIFLVTRGKRVFQNIPIKKLRLISGILLAIMATPLIVYSFGISAPEWIHWITPPLR